MFKDITLGQYFPGNSVIHRLDPRTKLAAMIIYIAMVFSVKTMALYAAVAVFLVALLLISRIPVSYVFKAVKPMRWLLVFMFIINMFLIKSGRVIFSWKFITLTVDGIEQAFFIVIRLVLLVCGTSLLTLTTTPISLTDGLERIMSPLAKIKFPAHELAMMMMIALRFIPTLLEEAERIMKAQAARGADFESGNIFKRAKNMIPILIPLFISAFRRADELASAMECRCYNGGEGRTRLRQLKAAPRDFAALAVTVIFLGVIIVADRLLKNNNITELF